MSKLNTVFNLDKVINTNSDLTINEEGLLNIKYSGTTASDESNSQLKCLITRDGDYLHIKLEVKFSLNNECSRCLKITKSEESIEVIEKLYLKNQNEYDLDFNNDLIDIYPILSEKVIDSISLVTLCSSECLGLCSICGKDQNLNKCSHEEKNLKESPFSSLSELDL